LAAIDLTDVTLRRDGTEILRGVTWRAERGEFWGIIGPNGSGKSSLAQMLAGYYYPTSGSVTILGERFGHVEIHSLRRRISFLNMAKIFEADRFMTAEQVAASGMFGTLHLFDDPSDKQWRTARAKLAELGISDLAERRMQRLSDGEKMKVLLARALLAESEMVVLDEPTAGLDVPSREACLKTLDSIAGREDAPTLVVVTHHPEELPASLTHCLLMSEGRAHSCGPAAEVITSARLTEVYGATMTVEHEAGRFWIKAGK